MGVVVIVADLIEAGGIGWCSLLFSSDKWEIEDPDRFSWALSLMDIEVEGVAAEVIAVQMIEAEVEEEVKGWCSLLFSSDKWEVEDPDRFSWALSLMDIEVEGVAAEVIGVMIEAEVEEEVKGWCSLLFLSDKWEVEDPDRFSWALTLMDIEVEGVAAEVIGVMIEAEVEEEVKLISLGMIVILLAWMAQSCVSSKRPTK